MVDQHIAERRGGDRRRPARAARRRPTSSASSRRPPTGSTISAFREKPTDAVGLPDAPDQVFASMGNYVFTRRGADRGGHRRRRGRELQARHGRQHHPDARRARRGAGLRLLAQRGAGGERRATAATGATSGRSTRTTTRTWTSSRSTRCSTSTTSEWPILTWPDPLPPAKFVFDEDDGRRGQALDSMVCAGVVISGATVRRSVLSPGVHLHSYAEVEDSSSCRASTSAATRSCAARSSTRTCGSRRARRSASTPTADRERFTVSAGGVVVIPKGTTVEA